MAQELPVGYSLEASMSSFARPRSLITRPWPRSKSPAITLFWDLCDARLRLARRGEALVTPTGRHGVCWTTAQLKGLLRQGLR
jgi:hypothetical protein